MNTEQQQQTKQQLILSIPKEIMDFHIQPCLKEELKIVNMLTKLSKYADPLNLQKLYLHMDKTITKNNLLTLAKPPTDKKFNKWRDDNNLGKLTGLVLPEGISIRSKEGVMLYILAFIKYAALIASNNMKRKLDAITNFSRYNGRIHIYLCDSIGYEYRLLQAILFLLPNKKNLKNPDWGKNYFLKNLI